MKVEASKFTEVGYVGRDVESMIRDLVDIAVDMVREEKLDEIGDRAEQAAENRLLDLLVPRRRKTQKTTERPATSCASGCGKANSTSVWWNSK